MTAAEQDRARAMVYPLANTQRYLSHYLTHRLGPAPDPRGFPLVSALRSLESAERIARSMFPADYAGL